MAKAYGKDIAITWDSIAIAATTQTITVNGNPVDVSDSGSSGWRVLMATPGEKSVDLSITGYTLDHAVMHKFGTAAAATITLPTGYGTITGTFYLANYVLTGEYKEAIEFTADLQSSGVITFTPPA